VLFGIRVYSCPLVVTHLARSIPSAPIRAIRGTIFRVFRVFRGPTDCSEFRVFRVFRGHNVWKIGRLDSRPFAGNALGTVSVVSGVVCGVIRTEPGRNFSPNVRYLSARNARKGCRWECRSRCHPAALGCVLSDQMTSLGPSLRHRFTTSGSQASPQPMSSATSF
jgi:hypothetical protein